MKELLTTVLTDPSVRQPEALEDVALDIAGHTMEPWD